MTDQTRGLNRRSALRQGAAIATLASAATVAAPYIARGQAKKHELPKLPYADDALAPVISAQTVGIHYGRHHKGYLDGMNAALDGPAKDLANLSLEDLIKTTRANPARAGLFNAAAQVWNHTFYWNGLKANGGGQPAGKAKAKIDADLGGYEKFKEGLARASITQFASGWGWLVLDKGKLAFRQTSNAECPVGLPGVTPIFTIDVWEHAYYLDYQNRRADYVNAVIDKLINWEFVEKNLG
jgi:Fe-Mn family superoxide dismutase